MATSAASRDRTNVLARGLTGPSALRLGGSMLALAGSIILLGIISGEALYPAAYSTAGNEISDLGGTTPASGGIVYQPAATIFNFTMIASGLLVATAAVLVHRGFGRRAVTIPMLILGLGALGVGVFPGPTGTPHALSAMTTFVAGGIAAVTSSIVVRGPFRWLSLLLGLVSLLTIGSYLVMGDGSPFAVFGTGGLERWIAYPIVLWIVAFGGYAAGRGEA